MCTISTKSSDEASVISAACLPQLFTLLTLCACLFLHVQQWKETWRELARTWNITFTSSDLIKREAAVLNKRIADGFAEDELEVSTTLSQLMKDNPAARIGTDVATLAAMEVDDADATSTAAAALPSAAATAAATTAAPTRKKAGASLLLPTAMSLSGAPLEVAKVTALQSIAASLEKLVSTLSGVKGKNARAAAAVRIATHRYKSMRIVSLDLTLYMCCA